MGAGASTGASAKQHKAGVEVTGSHPEFRCAPLENLDDCPKALLLRVGPESLQVLNTQSVVLHTFPYHTIMCWGHNNRIFKWRVFDAASDKLTDVVVATAKGSEIEVIVMDTVKLLMAAMESKGVPDKKFKSILASLEEDGDKALSTLRQVAVSNRFDVKQGVAVVKAISKLSPFDMVESAIVMYESLINVDSFPLVLECFPDQADRDNICHRLQIKVDASGAVEFTGKRKRNNLKAARKTTGTASSSSAPAATPHAAPATATAASPGNSSVNLRTSNVDGTGAGGGAGSTSAGAGFSGASSTAASAGDGASSTGTGATDPPAGT